jgi:signal transduction histidine kinase
MNMKKIKWIAILLPALFVGLFEMLRHDLLGEVPTAWGNLMVAGVAAITSFIYYHGIFTLIQNLNKKLQEEKEGKATLKERDRIARELHDSVSQALFFMNIKAREIEDSVKQQREPLEEVRELRKAIKITDADVRQHIFNLQMASQTNIDFDTAIQAYIKNFKEQTGLQMELNIAGNYNDKLSNRVKSQLLRVFQEALWNIRKHSEARMVRIQLLEKKNEFLMIIQDDGKGFNVNDLKERESPFGLKIVEERVQSIGAKFNIESDLGKGTTVSIQLPLNKD